MQYLKNKMRNEERQERKKACWREMRSVGLIDETTPALSGLTRLLYL